MKRDALMSAVIAAEKKSDLAWRAVNRAVHHAFPIGTHVAVRLGGHLVHGVVTSAKSPDTHCSFECGYVYILNTETDRPRKFHAPSSIEDGTLEIVSRPAQAVSA